MCALCCIFLTIYIVDVQFVNPNYSVSPSIFTAIHASIFIDKGHQIERAIQNIGKVSSSL